MSKKELTEEELLKKEYSNLVKLNQKLKNICSGYYIGYDGMIYMQSLVPFIEKVLVLNEPEKYSRFYGIMIMPNAFFEFTKNAKKTKLIITQTQNAIHLGQNDNDELTHTLNVANPYKDIDDKYIREKIYPNMYKRYFELDNDELYHKYPDSDKGYILTSDGVKSLASANPVFLSFNDTVLTITKQLMMDIKKEDEVYIYRTCYQEMENNKYRVFYTIEHVTDLYKSYTIFNTIQS
jgi:hypothetical protein